MADRNAKDALSSALQPFAVTLTLHGVRPRAVPIDRRSIPGLISRGTGSVGWTRRARPSADRFGGGGGIRMRWWQEMGHPRRNALVPAAGLRFLPSIPPSFQQLRRAVASAHREERHCMHAVAGLPASSANPAPSIIPGNARNHASFDNVSPCTNSPRHSSGRIGAPRATVSLSLCRAMRKCAATHARIGLTPVQGDGCGGENAALAG